MMQLKILSLGSDHLIYNYTTKQDLSNFSLCLKVWSLSPKYKLLEYILTLMLGGFPWNVETGDCGSKRFSKKVLYVDKSNNYSFSYFSSCYLGHYLFVLFVSELIVCHSESILTFLDLVMFSEMVGQ